MRTIKDKHILITGGASGIGLLMGRDALQKGAAQLIIWDISEDHIQQALQTLAPYAGQVQSYTVDITDSNQVYKTAKQTLADCGYIDILINNAGVIAGGPFHDYSSGNIDQTLDVNLKGAIHTTRAFLPQMMERNTGHVVNIASAAGHIGNPNMSVYAGSKWGLIGWSKSLRLELEQDPDNDIGVTSVEPGYIKTGMFKGVQAPLLTPLLDPETLAKDVIRSVEKNRNHLRKPFMVKILPFLKGILPGSIFDFIVGKVFRVYHSMDTFEGRSSN